MEDQLLHTAVRLAIEARRLAFACAILALCLEPARAQSSLRVVSAPEQQAPARADGASIEAYATGSPDLFSHLSAATADRPATQQAQPKSQPAPSTTIRFADAPLPDITPIGSKPRAAAVQPPLNVDNYRFAAAIRHRVTPPSPAAAEPFESEQIEPRPIPLVQSERRETPPAPAPRLIKLDRAPVSNVTESGAAPGHERAQPETIAAAPTRIELQPPSRLRAPSKPVTANIAAAAPRPLAMPVVISSQPEPAPAPPAAREPYLGDALSAAAPYCDDNRYAESCPYLPWQSGTRAICGVDCGPYGAPCSESWQDSRWIPWSLLGPGEYVGPPRPEHVPAYYLRVNDLITLTYIVSRQKQADRYHIGVGDRLRIESSFDESLDRELEVQPDGDIHLPLIGDVPAAGKTIQELRDDLIRRFGRIERDPVITVTPLGFNTGLQEILNAVTSQSRLSGQAIDLRVTPEGTIQPPGLGSVYVQGLAIEELRSELEARYREMFGPGLLVAPALSERATSYVFLGGEVVNPGRYTLEGPTTVMQAITLAGGWNNGGNMREVVVFRRDENWCLKATKINVHRPLYGNDPCPVNDVWLRDNDLVIVPKTRILCAADVIELYFTRGVYAVFPITFVKDFSTGSTMAVPIP